MSRHLFVVAFVLCINIRDVYTQTRRLSMNGYIKYLHGLYVDEGFTESVSSSLIHNRINMKGTLAENITVVAEFRNRLFWGEEVRLYPDFSLRLRNSNEQLNLHKTWINNASMVLHTNTERLYADWGYARFNLRLGRQRINWGIATVWNPNDIFNVYNFLDFDYEERPGVDGVKVRYQLGDFSSVEFASTVSGNQNQAIGALKYAFNKFGYDIQLISGWYKDHPTAGAGWAGSIKDAGFKGEFQYFFKNEHSAAHMNLVLECDYMFKKGWYANTGLLLNNSGLYKPVHTVEAINLQLSPENLMPTKWNTILTAGKEINPLLSANVSTLYAPGTNFLILLPTFQYDVATDIAISLMGQSFFAEMNDRMKAFSHRFYLRIKWNF